MIKNPVWTAWSRLLATALILFMLGVAFGSQPIRSQTVDVEQVFTQSALLVFQCPALPLFWFGEALATVVAVGFWCALSGTAAGSGEMGTRRWFYVLFGIFVFMAAIGMLGNYAMGMIAMARAQG